MEKICIREYKTSDYDEYTVLFYKYFKEDIKIDITMDDSRDMCKETQKNKDNKIIGINVAFIDDELVGFIEYQVDTPRSDWNYSEGDGCIREVYIKEKYRGMKLGYLLNKSAEEDLWKEKIDRIYLTSDEDAIEFWKRCGYKETDKICERNKCLIMDKNRVEN